MPGCSSPLKKKVFGCVGTLLIWVSKELVGEKQKLVVWFFSPHLSMIAVSRSAQTNPGQSISDFGLYWNSCWKEQLGFCCRIQCGDEFLLFLVAGPQRAQASQEEETNSPPSLISLLLLFHPQLNK